MYDRFPEKLRTRLRHVRRGLTKIVTRGAPLRPAATVTPPWLSRGRSRARARRGPELAVAVEGHVVPPRAAAARAEGAARAAGGVVAALHRRVLQPEGVAAGVGHQQPEAGGVEEAAVVRRRDGARRGVQRGDEVRAGGEPEV